jgi:hypothetical protein
MKQLPIRGASLLTPRLGEDELKQVLAELRVIAVYSEADVQEVNLALAAVCGRWMAEEEAKQVDPVAAVLLKTGKSLIAASRLVNGRATGLRTQMEYEVTSQVIEILGLNPTVGSQAQDLVEAFQESAATVGEACLLAYADLARKSSNDGRDPLLWYDGFTALLLGISRKAGIKPNLNKDRETNAYGGWLFDAAQALEPFLDPYMRSPSPGACGKRLERSRKRLIKADRQNRPRR